MGRVSALAAGGKVLNPFELRADHIVEKSYVPLWGILAAQGAIGLGTMEGGWRIVKTMDMRLMVLPTAGRGLIALLVLASVTAASARDLTDILTPLLAARERGAFGAVDGRAYTEGQRGGAESTPSAAVSVLLLPRSAEFDAELEAIKVRYRDSPDAFLQAEPKMGAARTAFERALIDAGAGHLLLGESSDAAGAFRFANVPEGAWTLLAWRETPHAKRSKQLKTREAKRYKDHPQVFGYTAVVFWRMPVDVKAGEDVAVRLHDRNEWFTGIREDRRIRDPNQPSPIESHPAPR